MEEGEACARLASEFFYGLVRQTQTSGSNMAKGNDGNLLQHWVEAHLASRVVREAAATSLHVALTHGMRPFEPFEARKPGTSGYGRLDQWLSAARTKAASSGEPAVVSAYRACDASAERYPNSAEILAVVAGGRDNLHGTITESDPLKSSELSARWNASGVRVLSGSWRQHLVEHACPNTLTRPWLFSMDPMTFVKGNAGSDDANLRLSDLKMLSPVLAGYLRSGMPGAVSIFCFSLRSMTAINQYQLFKSAASFLARDLSCHVEFCEVPLSNRHVGAILGRHSGLLRETANSWKTALA